jgi:hypothetical protein
MVSCFADFDEASAAKAAQPGSQLCATLLGTGEPRYFLMPVHASADVIRDAAFEVREGRKPSSYENWLLELALERAERVSS